MLHSSSRFRSGALKIKPARRFRTLTQKESSFVTGPTFATTNRAVEDEHYPDIAYIARRANRFPQEIRRLPFSFTVNFWRTSNYTEPRGDINGEGSYRSSLALPCDFSFPGSHAVNDLRSSRCKSGCKWRCSHACTRERPAALHG